MRLVARQDERPTLEQWLAAHETLYNAAAADPRARVLQGRGAVYVVPRPGPHGGAQWVVRHYRRGGAVARFARDRYLRVGRPRPLREFALTRALETLGVPAPRPVGAAVYLHGPFYRGDLVTEYVPDTVDLAAVLFPPRRGGSPPDAGGPAIPPEAALRAAGALLRLLHERGVEHPDLNLKNVLVRRVDGGAEALVLDLDRARVRARVAGRSRRRMIRRFWRSARKWEAGTGARLDPSLAAAFEAGYASAPDG